MPVIWPSFLTFRSDVVGDLSEVSGHGRHATDHEWRGSATTVGHSGSTMKCMFFRSDSSWSVPCVSKPNHNATCVSTPVGLPSIAKKEQKLEGDAPLEASEGHAIRPTSYQSIRSISQLGQGSHYPAHKYQAHWYQGSLLSGARLRIDVDLCHSPPKWFNRFNTCIQGCVDDSM